MQNNPTDKPRKPRLGVSQCLLGDRVRYDAASKAHTVVLGTLAELFELVAICPEVEAGLGVPRPPVQLSGDIAQPRLTGRDQADLDITERMQAYTTQKLAALVELDGYVFKSRSPSCGLNTTPVYIDGICATETSRGVFARAVCQRYPDLPVIEDSELDSEVTLQNFIAAAISQAGQR